MERLRKILRALFKDNLPKENLLKKGINQAKKISSELKEKKIDFIYSSDLKRSSDTAEIIFKEHPQAHYKLLEDLRERSWGNFEGKTEEEIDFDNIKIKYQKDFEKPPKGEDLREFYERVKKFFEFLKEKHSKNCVLIVSHKNFLRTLIGIISNKKPEEVWDFGPISNERFYEFEI